MANSPTSPLHCWHGRIHFARIIGRPVAVCLLLIVGLNFPTLAWGQATTDTPVDVDGAESATRTVSDQQLFQDLQSEKFQVRENATNQLAKRGSIVLPEIAKRYFTAPPETVYRIRKILEGVGSSGDEQTFLRATSLLLTLYSSGNEEMVQRIEQLKADWRRRRKDDAVQVILAAGGKVVSEYNSQNHLQLRQAIVNRHANQGVSHKDASNPPARQQKLDVNQQRELVAKIMANSADDNRNFILEHSRANRSSKPKVVQFTYNTPPPLSVQFPDGWVADKRTLSKLDELDGPVALELGAVEMSDTAFPPDVRAITLRNYSLDPDFCRTLSQFSSLGVLQLSNCTLDDDSVAALNQLKRVSTIPVSFSDTKVDVDSIAALAKLKRGRAMAMDNVQISPTALAELEDLPQISTLKLSSMSIDDEFLESVGRMKRLGQLTLRGCKFDIDAFKRLESTSRIRIDFQPQAFLGVGPQGAGGPGRVGCQIAYIAPGSAAAREGIQVGDVIRSIDGDPVKTFQEVRLKIAQYGPGEKMPMTIQRADKVLKLNVELGKNSALSR